MTQLETISATSNTLKPLPVFFVENIEEDANCNFLSWTMFYHW